MDWAGQAFRPDPDNPAMGSRIRTWQVVLPWPLELPRVIEGGRQVVLPADASIKGRIDRAGCPALAGPSYKSQGGGQVVLPADVLFKEGRFSCPTSYYFQCA